MSHPEPIATDLQALLDRADPVASEPMPAGWSRRNWVQREAVAFGALFPNLSPVPIAE